MNLRVLGEHLRDGTWLDMEVCAIDYVGKPPAAIVLERVKIVKIIVRTLGEDLFLTQQWVNENDRRVEDELTFDAEAIRRCEPTSVSLLDVRPHKTVVVALPPLTDEDQLGVARVAIEEGALMFAQEIDHLASSFGGRGTWDLVHSRHKVIVVIYETTDLSPERICNNLFGYRSAGPFLLAVSKARRYPSRGQDTATEAFRADVAVLGTRVALRRGVTRRRQLPHDYQPCLSRP